jgi:hypothetical protein
MKEVPESVLEKISEGLDEVFAYIEDAQGEWAAVEIPYCPERIIPYKELSAMVERLQYLMADGNAKE